MNLRRITSLLGVLPLLALAANANHRAVLVVTSSVDYTPGCLRDMVASAAPGDVIKFGFPMIINLTAPIVVGVDNLAIEACYPDVVLNATALFPGLEFQGVTGCKVLGLRMEGFNGALIFANGANGNKVGGLNPCDRVEVHNGGYGIVLTDVGTVNNEFYNVVSRNNINEGIYLRSGASYNQFGDGTYGGAVFSYANTLNGLLLETTPAYVGAVEYNEFRHCLIGTDLTGYVASGNARSGVALNGCDVTNNSFTKCVLSGNAVNGVSISTGASLNKFTACHIGTDIDGKIALGNIVGVDIACGSQNSLDSLNVISGNYSDGVRIHSSTSCLNLVHGNALGPDVNGNALGNGGSGIALLNGTWANQVTQNHISSNLGNGVLLSGNGMNSNNVELNVVGTDQAASVAMPNGLNGIFLDVGACDNDFKENIVSGNTQYGIAIGASGCDRNEFKGNVVGLDNARVNAIPNGAGGVLVLGSDNLFGGMIPNQGNYICANTGWGVEVRGSAVGFYAVLNEFLGNTIGLPGLGNLKGGVFLDSGAVENFVGGDIPTTGGVPGNNIWNNYGPGVLVENAATADPAYGNQILTNSITDNSGLGIELGGTANCMIPAPIITHADSAGVTGYANGPGFSSSFPCRVQVFRDSDDEGSEYLGEDWVMSGYGAFSVSVSLAPGDRVTATQTALYGCPTMEPHTSPFSTPMTAISVGTLDCFCVNSVAPCLNPDPTAGCANSTGVGGTLNAHGSTSVLNDDLTLSAEQLPIGTFAMLLGSLADRNIPFRDGRLCVGGSGSRIWRFQIRNSGQWGAVVYGDGLVARSFIFSTSGHINSGDTWYFQTYYRDILGPCSTGGNLTNTVKIAFTL